MVALEELARRCSQVRFGAKVFATVADETPAAFCRGHGAHRTIDYGDFVVSFNRSRRRRRHLGYYRRRMRAEHQGLRTRCGYSSTRTNGGSKVNVNLMPIMLKRLVLPVRHSGRVQTRSRLRWRENLKRTFGPKLQPDENVIHQSFNLAQAADAIE